MTTRANLPRYEGVPNLDAMSDRELMDFWLVYRSPSRKDAEALIGDRRKGYTGLASSLAGYASNKATAITCRERGDIRAAQIYEQICDFIYEKLPEDILW
jgi:hypothetical protein